jgi:hypothetical protein
MTELPYSTKLPINHLAASFDNTTNSYKFYWFLAILEYIKETNSRFIPLNHLLAKMVASVWYPTNYFYLSFGKQDRLSKIALNLKAENKLAIDAKHAEVVDTVLVQIPEDSTLSNEITSLCRFVPYRFLRPFFANELRSEKDYKINRLIVELAENGFSDADNLCLYRFVSDPENGIELQKDWFEYLQQHLTILLGFCLWHLLNYLQKNNPNVPNIASKLFEPRQRDLKQARNFWRLAFDQIGTIHCVYSRQAIQKDSFSLDHFLPWRFVTHDLLWNIIPVPKNVNSAKSDNLPAVDTYLVPFAQLQYTAFQAVAKLQKQKLLEDYVLLFKKENVAEVKAMPSEQFVTLLYDTIAPQIQIAQNMGFAADWSYVTV